MVGTLYKAKTPTTFEDGEYYRPDFQVGFMGRMRVYFVRETHGF
jgi:hypothetical protein